MVKKDSSVDVLDMLRIGAMMIVLLHHIAQRIYLPSSVNELTLNMGFAGVSVFFVLSGFLIPDSYKRSESNLVYFIKRAFRILPVYYIVLILNIVFRPMPIDLTGVGWLRYFFFINLIIPAYDAEWNSFAGLWTISIFVIYYLLVPLLTKLCKKCKQTTLFWIVLAMLSIVFLKLMGLYFQNQFNGNMDFINRSFLRMLPVFLMGTGANQAIKEKREKEYSFVVASFMLILGCLDILNDFFLYGAISAILVVNMNSVSIPVSKQFSKVLKTIGGV